MKHLTAPPSSLARLALVLAAGVAAAAPARGQSSELERAHIEVPRLPGMSALSIAEIVEGGASGVYRLELHAETVSARAFQPEPGAGNPWLVALRPDEPAAFALDPAFRRQSEALLGTVRPSELVLVSSGRKADAPLSGFPSDLARCLGPFAGGGEKIALAEGVNLFAALRPAPGSLLGRLERLLGWKGPLRLVARVDAGTLQTVLRLAGAPDEVFSPPDPSTGIEISIQLPEFAPLPYDLLGDPELIDMRCLSTTLKTSFASKDAGFQGKATLALEGQQRVRVWLLGRAFEGEGGLKVELEGSQLSVERSGKIKVGWKDAFGFPGVGLEELSLAGKLGDIELGSAAKTSEPEAAPTGRARANADADQHPTERPAAAESAPTAKQDGPKVELGLGAVVLVGGGRKVDGRFGVQLEGGKVSELQLALSWGDTGVGLRDLPGFTNLPGNDRFKLNDLVLAYGREHKDVCLGGKATWVERGISGRCVIARTHTDKGKAAALLVMQCESVSLSDLVPGLPKGAELPLDKALLALCTASLDGVQAGSLGDPIKDLLKTVQGDLERPVAIGQGLTLMLGLDPRGLKGQLGEGMKRLGVTEPLVLAGSLGGLSSGAPQLALYADLPSLPVPPGAAKFLDVGPRRGRRAGVEDARARFFLAASAEAGNPQLRLGFDGVVGVRLGDDELDVGGQLFVIVSAVSQGVRLSGKVLGEWNDPFGLEGVQLRDVVVGGGVDADSSVELALAGGATIGEFSYDMAGLLSLVTASGVPVPKKLGFKFEGSELSQITQVQLMSALVRSAVAGPLAGAIPRGDAQDLLRRVSEVDLASRIGEVIPLPLLEFRDVSVFVATPGASFPDMDLGGLGVGLRGSMSFMDRELGRVDNFLTLQDGLQIHGSPGSVDIGLVRLTGAEVELRVPMPGLPLLNDDPARFRLTGDAGAGCSFLTGALDVEVTRDEARFRQDVKLAGYATRVEAKADLSRYPSCLLAGRFDRDLALDVLETVKQAVRRRSEKALADAKQKVEQTRQGIAATREEVEDARAKARKRLRAEVEDQLDGVRKQLRRMVEDYPAVDQALQAAERAAGKLRLAKDDTVDGVGDLRSKLQSARSAAEKVPGKIAAKVKDELAAVRGKLDAAVDRARAIAGEVEDDLGVTKARERLAEAQATLKGFSRTLMRERVDPVAAYATQLVDSLEIEQVGFDAGLETLCNGRLPKLNVRGSFAGRPFDLRQSLELSRKGELAQRNAKALDAFVAELLRLIDEQEAAAFGDSLAEA